MEEGGPETQFLCVCIDSGFLCRDNVSDVPWPGCGWRLWDSEGIDYGIDRAGSLFYSHELCGICET